MPTSNGQPFRVRSIGRRWEDHLRARLAALVHFSADAIVGETLDGVITDWNPAAERLYGFTASEVVGRHMTMLIPPDRLAEAEAILARVRRGESVEDVETVRWTKDGQRRDVCLTISPVWNEAGELMATSAIVRDITERKASATALAASEALLQAAFDNAPVGMILATSDEQILRVNRVLSAMLGYTTEELTRMSFWTVTHPEDIAASRTLMQRALGGEIATYELETRYVHRDGHMVWAHLSGSLVRGETGEPLYFIAQIQDITARKAAEAERTATHHQTYQLLERITDSFYALDRAWCFTYVNGAAERIFGRPREALLGKNIWDEFAHAIETPVYAAFHEALAEGTAIALEISNPALNAWYHVHVYPAPEGLAVFFRDVTEHWRLEEDLRASEEKYRTLVEHLPALVYMVGTDDAQTPRYFSPYLETLTGYRPEEALARSHHWLEAVHPDDRARVAAADARALATGEPLRVEYRYRRKDGSYVWVLDESIVIRDERGTLVALHGVLLDISDRVQAEQALAASEVRFRAAFENAAIGMTLVRPDGRILQANDAIGAMLGLSADALVGRRFQEFTHPDDLESNLALIRSAVAGERETYELEKRYVRPNGQLVWAHLSASLVRDEDGDPQYLIAQIQDINARKEAEAELARRSEELRASEIRFRTLVEQLPAAVYLLTTKAANESPLYFSPYVTVVTGETPEEAMISHAQWFELIHPEDRARVAAADARAGAQVEAFRAEYRHQRKDGSYVWVQDEYVPVKDETGRAVAWLGVLLDITDRIRAEEAQARLAAIVESAEDAIISSTFDGTIASWNRGAERLFGYRAEEALGQPFTMLLPDDPNDPTLEWRRATLAGASVPPFETTRRRRDGTTIAASIALSPIRDRDGQIVGISSINRDITERKQLEADLRAALTAAEGTNQAKSHFLAMMSHELRTPLQAVLGYSEFLLTNPVGRFTAEERDDLGYIQQGGRRMLTLVNQLLDLSRIEAGRLDLVRRPVDLAWLIEQVRQDVAPQASQKGLDLQIDLPPALPSVLGDADRLRQILLNLVGNAVKFTEHGAVQITARTTAAGLAVIVRDTGCGVTPEALPHIFEMFQQVDSRLARQHGGAGLGLAIAQKLAELMGGKITVESTLGDGSTFTLQVPVATPVR